MGSIELLSLKNKVEMRASRTTTPTFVDVIIWAPINEFNVNRVLVEHSLKGILIAVAINIKLMKEDTWLRKA